MKNMHIRGLLFAALILAMTVLAGCSRKPEAAPDQVAEALFELLFKDDTAPVSYTHLDVYKRQLCRHPGGPSPGDLGSGRQPGASVGGGGDVGGTLFPDCLLSTKML